MLKSKTSLLFIVLFLPLAQLMATHIVGGALTYECLTTNPNATNKTFRFTLKVYRDCFGGQANFDNPAYIGIYRGSYQSNSYVTQNTVTLDEFRPIGIDNPECLNGVPNVCLEEATYVWTAVLAKSTQSYFVVYQRCCRNNTVTNIFNPSQTGATFYVEITPRAFALGNSSPQFKEPPPTIVCNNYPMEVDYSATDQNGDRLVYSFCKAYTGGGQTGGFANCDTPQPQPACAPPFDEVQFIAPVYTPEKPMAGDPLVVVDPQTGIISGTPTKVGQYVVAVCVEEYRNGELLSVVRREYQFNVTACAPQISAKIKADSVVGKQSYVVKSCTGSKTVKLINESFDKNNIKTFRWKVDLNNGQFYESATAFDPEITFPAFGSYKGVLYLNENEVCSDTAFVRIDVLDLIELNLGPDRVKCPDEAVILSIDPGQFRNFQWNNGSKNNQLGTILPGTYWCEGLNTCGQKLRDSVLVSNRNNCPCPDSSFFKKYGITTDIQHSTTLCAAKDGTIYMAGNVNNKTFISKISNQAVPLWTREFKINASTETYITDMIEDSEGNLVGLGMQTQTGDPAQAVAFRYNPGTNQFLWIKDIDITAAQTASIAENPINNNFLLCVNTILSADPMVQVLELQRASGNVFGGKSRIISSSSGLFANTMLEHKGRLYLGGWVHTKDEDVPPFAKSQRQMLMQLDAGSLLAQWATAGPEDDTNNNISYNGHDLIIDQDSLVSIFSSLESPGNKRKLYVQKSSLDGNLAWVKEYDSNLQPEEIFAVPDGYLISAFDGFSKRYLLKINKNGIGLFQKELFVQPPSVLPASADLIQDQIIAVNNRLFLTATDGSTLGDILLWKMNANGAVLDACGFEKPTDLAWENVGNPVTAPISLGGTTGLEFITTRSTTTSTLNLASNTLCACSKLACDEVLDLGPDIILCKDSTIVLDAGPGFVAYTWQDNSILRTFTATKPGIYTVAVTDSCGEVLRDTILITLSQVADVKLADSTICIGESVSYSIPGFDQYTWSPATGLNCNNCANITASPTVTTTYNILATNKEGCIKEDQFTITVAQPGTRTQVIQFYKGQSVTVDGKSYSAPATVVVKVASPTEVCDSIITYILEIIPTSLDLQCPANLTVALPSGANAIPVNYNQPTATTDCPDPKPLITLLSGPASGANFAAGVTQVCYTAVNTCSDRDSCCFNITATTLDLQCPSNLTVAIPNGSNTVPVTYTQPSSNTNCPDPTVNLVRTEGPASGDAFAKGVTQVCFRADNNCGNTATCCFSITATTLDLSCPPNQTLSLQPGVLNIKATYADPTGAGNCPDANITLKLLEGKASGENFGPGTTKICYEGSNTCGNRDSCCFTINVQEFSNPCDVKVIGCIKFELLDIRFDSVNQRRYRIRATNNCASDLNWVAYQLPNGVTAPLPKENSVFTAPGGRTYDVRNPNFSPFYSIRYKTKAAGMNNGKSDVFEYRLPQQSEPRYIHAAARTADGAYYEAHLNTFYCPVQAWNGQRPEDSQSWEDALLQWVKSDAVEVLSAYPNPTDGLLYVEFPQQWLGQNIRLEVLNAQGQLLMMQENTANGNAVLDLNGLIANGLYYLSAQAANGEKMALRFVFER